MITDKDFDDMAECCVAAAERVKRDGTPELQTVMRVLLYILAGEMVERATMLPRPEEQAANGGGRL